MVEQHHSGSAKILSGITELIARELPDDCQPEAIYLSGGFARNESGWYRDRDYLLPFGDLDLDVVVPKILLDRDIEGVYQALFERFRFQPVTAPSEPTLVAHPDRFNVLDLRFKTREEFLQRSPDLATIDFLASHQLLCGNNLVEQMPILNLSRIPLFSPWRILSNRLLLLLKHTPAEFIVGSKQPTPHEIMAFRLAWCRCYLDLAGLLVFLLGRYESSSKERLAVLQERTGLWKFWYPDVDAFLERLQQAYQFKKHPQFPTTGSPWPVDCFFQLLEDVGYALPHAISLILLSHRLDRSELAGVLNMEPRNPKPGEAVRNPYQTDWRFYIRQQAREYPTLFYREYIKQHLAQHNHNVLAKWGWFCRQAAKYYGMVEHYLWLGKQWVVKHPRDSKLAPRAFQAAYLPSLLFSLTPQQKLVPELVELAEKGLQRYGYPPPEKDSDPLLRWEHARSFFVETMLDSRTSGK